MLWCLLDGPIYNVTMVQEKEPMHSNMEQRMFTLAKLIWHCAFFFVKDILTTK